MEKEKTLRGPEYVLPPPPPEKKEITFKIKEYITDITCGVCDKEVTVPKDSAENRSKVCFDCWLVRK